MKVIIKCGNDRFLSDRITKFFLENILPVLDAEIAIEYTTNNTVYVYKKNDQINIDKTVEIIVELTEEVRIMALEKKFSVETLKIKSGKFYDEVMAIRKIEEINPFFSREYYSCNYRRGTGE